MSNNDLQKKYYGLDFAHGGCFSIYTVYCEEKKSTIRKTDTTMRYYKVIKENFLWDVDAILQPCKSDSGYEPIDDIYKKHEGGEYISKDIIENSPDYFKRVYKVDMVTRVVYEAKDKAKELMSKSFKAE